MNYVRCKNDHFFDIETYQVCPNCGEAPIMQKKAGEPKTGGRFFDKMKNKLIGDGKNKIDIPEKGVQTDGGIPGWGDIDLSFGDFSENSGGGAVNPENRSWNPIMDDNDKTERLNFEEVRNQEVMPNEQNTWKREEPVAPEWESGDTLLDEVRRRSATKDGKTMGIFEIMAEEHKQTDPKPEPERATVQPESSLEAVKEEAAGSGKTVSFFASAVSTAAAVPGEPAVSAATPAPQAFHEPVVGWLVAVTGPHIGIGFPLKAGKNTIGRESENDIVLGLDRAVSRVRHATLIYEPRQRVFYLQPGDASGLCYVNGDYCMETVKVKAGDFLEFGETKLYFVPLCSENFAWEDYLKKE